MNQKEFLNKLQIELESRQISNIPDIIKDYEDHFFFGLAKGKSEQEISESLGDPDSIAKAFHTEKLVQNFKKQKSGPFPWKLAFQIIGKLLILAPFNLLILFFPGIPFFAVLFASWIITGALLIMGISSLTAIPFLSALDPHLWWFLTGLFGSLSLISLALFLTLFLFWLTTSLLKILISYLEWNTRFITSKQEIQNAL